MKCFYCGKSDVQTMDINIPNPDPNKDYGISACISCAIRNDMYCTLHDTKHEGFEDGTTACLKCAMESASTRTAGEYKAFSALMNNRPDPENKRLGTVISLISGVLEESAVTATMYVVYCKAMRCGITAREVVDRHIGDPDFDMLI